MNEYNCSNGHYCQSPGVLKKCLVFKCEGVLTRIGKGSRGPRKKDQ